MDPRLLEYYNSELRFLRESGAEFASAYPRVAARLGIDSLEVADPTASRAAVPEMQCRLIPLRKSLAAGFSHLRPLKNAKKIAMGCTSFSTADGSALWPEGLFRPAADSNTAIRCGKSCATGNIQVRGKSKFFSFSRRTFAAVRC